MKELLAPPNAAVLAQWAKTQVLLAFDFDGTLAPIVSDRDRAEMRPETRALFMQLCRLYPCAVISGRRLADVKSRLQRAPIRFVVGNHGLEPARSAETFSELMREARATLSQELTGVPGVDIEDKRHSLSIHYRGSRRQVVQATRALGPGLRVVDGKQVVNVVPDGAPNKGDALIDLRARSGCDTALYVGDDVTDEDVFRLHQPGKLLSVRVGRALNSRATWYVRQQSDIDRLLRRLISLRCEPLNGRP